MTLAMKLLCRVIKRRVQAGEKLKVVLSEYPKLTKEEKTEIQKIVQE